MFAVEIADFLDEREANFGAVRDVPMVICVSQLGFSEALVNVWTAVSVSVAYLFVVVWLGFAMLFASILSFDLVMLLGALAVLFFFPIICLAMPWVILTGLAFSDASWAYDLVFVPVFIVRAIPVVAISLLVVGLILCVAFGAFSGGSGGPDFAKTLHFDSGTLRKLTILGWLR